MFGGAGEAVNLVPMNSKLNGSGGKFYNLEQEWKDAIEAGSSVKVNIVPNYSSGNRPDSFTVSYSIDGVPVSPQTIGNNATGVIN